MAFHPRDRDARWISRGLRIAHEDADVLVVDKASGMLSVTPPGQSTASAFEHIKSYVKARHRGKSRAPRVWVIHRLDKEASGLLIFALSQRAFDWLKEDLRAKRITRLYAAVVEGELPQPPAPEARGSVQSFLRERGDGTVESTATGQPARGGEEEAKPALTHYEVLASAQGRSLLRLRLQTGRKHQIRVHMKELGHPIVGDRRYGARTNPLDRLALHASELSFVHPASGETIRLRSPAPAAFWRSVGRKPPAEFQDLDPEQDLSGSKAPAPPPAGPRKTKGDSTSWDHVASWYTGLIQERGSDHHEDVILPGTLRLLRAKPGQRVLDVACGQGVLCHRLAQLGVEAVGVDASAGLITAARTQTARAKHAVPPRFEVMDARELPRLTSPGRFDAAACVMALMNIEPLDPVLSGVASLLRPGGAFVAVILHPAFRAPGQTSWGWEKPGQQGSQFRRVDGYLSAGQSSIVMNPGAASRGKEAVTTWTFHRPIQTYARALAQAGFVIEELEEWPSLRTSEKGPKAAEENRARREIPMFLALRAALSSPPLS